MTQKTLSIIEYSLLKAASSEPKIEIDCVESEDAESLKAARKLESKNLLKELPSTSTIIEFEITSEGKQALQKAEDER